jgi:hypothetical protein
LTSDATTVLLTNRIREITLPERVVVIVSPQDGQLNLTVEDAMRQVLDAFGLLARSGPSNNGVVWRLIEAKTNSPPFSVIAEASSLIPNVNIDDAARAQALSFAYSMKELKAGRTPNDWSETDAEEIVAELFQRLTHSINTEIRVNGEVPIVLTKADSPKAAYALEYSDATGENQTRTKQQIGSIDGVICEVTTHHKKPAIVVQERKSNRKITCLISAVQTDKIGNSNNFADVWKHCRVVVRGVLLYNNHGDILRIKNASISRHETKEVTLEQIKDSNFTTGLSSIDYLDKLGDGELGG